MPWKSLGKFSKRLAANPAAGRKAARQANAILRSGAPEGVAIATAMKHANKNPHAGALRKATKIKKLAGDLQAHEQESVSSSRRKARMTGMISPRAERKHLDVDATATMQ